jgi:prephenate dehydrogenase
LWKETTVQNVTIVGLGLIGGSIGLGLKRWSNNNGKREDVLHITGFDLDIQHQNYAKKVDAVDRTEWNLENAVADADLVVLAVPPLAVKETFASMSELLKAGAVVTDVTSTKADVMVWAAELLPDTVSFVGGHPMAGGAQSLEAASADLFQDATWCVVPSVSADEAAVQTVLGMINALGAEPLFVDAHEHDGFVGGVSHLPFMLSTVLMLAVSRDPSWRDMKILSASGFRDVSRLAAASPEMHRDICVTNRQAVVRWLDEAVEQIQHLRSLVTAGSDEADETLLALFEEARDARADWATTERRPGTLAQETEDELNKMSVGSQFSQLMFGSFFRRRMPGGRGEPEKRDETGERPQR